MKGNLSQFGVVDEVGSVSVDEGAQSQAVLPTERRRKRGKKGSFRKVKEETVEEDVTWEHKE